MLNYRRVNHQLNPIKPPFSYGFPMTSHQKSILEVIFIVTRIGWSAEALHNLFTTLFRVRGHYLDETSQQKQDILSMACYLWFVTDLVCFWNAKILHTVVFVKHRPVSYIFSYISIYSWFDEGISSFGRISRDTFTSDIPCNVGIAIINHPPFITIFMGGIPTIKSGWCQWQCSTHISQSKVDRISKSDPQRPMWTESGGAWKPHPRNPQEIGIFDYMFVIGVFASYTTSLRNIDFFSIFLQMFLMTKRDSTIRKHIKTIMHLLLFFKTTYIYIYIHIFILDMFMEFPLFAVFFWHFSGISTCPMAHFAIKVAIKVIEVDEDDTSGFADEATKKTATGA